MNWIVRQLFESAPFRGNGFGVLCGEVRRVRGLITHPLPNGLSYG